MPASSFLARSAPSASLRSHGRWQASRCASGDRLGGAAASRLRTARSGRGSADGTGSPSAGASSDGGEPFDRHERVEPLVDRRHRVEQPPGIRMLRLREDLGRRPVLHHVAGVHHHDRVRGLRDDAEVVRDEDHADLELALDLLDQLEDLRLHRHVERGRRLVADEDGRVVERAPSRSSRAGACRPRTGAGSRAHAMPRSGCRRGRAARRRAPRRASLPTSSCAVTASAIWSPTRYIGCRHANGSWKTIAMSLPRIFRSSSGGSVSRSRPLNSTSPEITVRSRLSSPMIARFETLFPEPDSPTTPSVSPRRERERDVGDRLDDAVRRREADGEPADVEQLACQLTRSGLAGRGTRRGCRRAGSRTRRRRTRAARRRPRSAGPAAAPS